MSAVHLAKGQNAPLPATEIEVVVEVAAAADLSALLLTAAGKVRGDQDIVFYNQPDGPGIRCLPPTNGQPWRLQLRLNETPAAVEKIRVVTSLDDAGRTFGSLPSAPVAKVAASDGSPVATTELSGLSSESIVIAVEFYRRDGAWKIRSVGQGYGGGLADLMRDHGVDVADEQPAPSHTPAPQAASTPQAPAVPSGQPTASAPPPPVAHHDPYAAPFASQAPPQPSPGPAPTAPPASAPQGGYDPYAQRPSTSAPDDGSRLTRGRPVNLSKGQSVNLRKDDGSNLSVVRMGLGWDPVQRGGMLSRRTADIDLDASAILLAGNDIVDLVFYNRLASADGSVRHTGDNRTGAGDGDDEVIMLDLARIPVHVTGVVLVVTSYEGHTFQMVQNAFCRLIDESGRGGEMVRYGLSGGDASTGMVMAALHRTPSGWRMKAIGEAVQARVPQETFPVMHRFSQ